MINCGNHETGYLSAGALTYIIAAIVEGSALEADIVAIETAPER